MAWGKGKGIATHPGHPSEYSICWAMVTYFFFDENGFVIIQRTVCSRCEAAVLRSERQDAGVLVCVTVLPAGSQP